MIRPAGSRDTPCPRSRARRASDGLTSSSPTCNPYGVGGSGVYVLDPPLGSVALGSGGSRKSGPEPGPGNAYYEGGDDHSDAHRATEIGRYTDIAADLLLTAGFDLPAQLYRIRSSLKVARLWREPASPLLAASLLSYTG